MAKEISILIGGKAGDGVKQTGNFIGRLLNRLGWRIFIYDDYPSLITGGHNFSVVRASEKDIFSHRSKPDIVVALNDDTIKKHKSSFKEETIVIYDSDTLKETQKEWIGVPMLSFTKKKNLPPIARDAVVLGIFASLVKADFKIVEDIIKTILGKKAKANIEVARLGYDFVEKLGKHISFEKLENKPLPLLTGNEAVALGAVKAGLKTYVAYPMTPASGILHFLAAEKEKLEIAVVQPENEIAVALMAEGLAFAGVKSMVGTSGGGFALMTEALSLTGMAEIPMVFVLSQRTSPSTGVPTYTMQGDLAFALSAGHGEFLRIVSAPGDANEAFYLAGEAMNLAWKFQIPVILLLDKQVSESTFSASFDENKIKVEEPKLWNKKGEYKRYLDMPDGVSPLAFPGDEGAVVKGTSYEHDEYGITTEEPEAIKKMVEKRFKKQPFIEKELMERKTAKVYGNKKSRTVLITWGSTKGVVQEVGEELGLKVVQLLYLEPFPSWKLKRELEGAEKIIDIEVNVTGLLAKLLKCNGFSVSEKILKYDSRPFTVDELKEKIWEKIK